MASTDLLTLKRARIVKAKGKGSLMQIDCVVDGNQETITTWIPTSEIKQEGTQYRLKRWLVEKKEEEIVLYEAQKKGRQIQLLGILVEEEQ